MYGRQLKMARVVQWLAGMCLVLFASQAWALDIMLVNDDGCTTSGINVLANELQSRGHHVTIYAPAGNQSGQAGRIIVPNGDYTAIFHVSNKGLHGNPTSKPGRYCVSVTLKDSGDPGGELPLPFASANQEISASPSGSVRVGLALLPTKPDLIISGINSAANTGLMTTHSGTVAGAVTALNMGIPAIAASRSVLGHDYQNAADFVADVVDRLIKQAQTGEPLLPGGIGLNINYPSGTPKGVIFTRVGHATPVIVGVQKVTNHKLKAKFTLDFAAQGIPADQIEQEGTALREGYVSVSVIKPNYGASEAAQSLIQLKLHGIKP